LTKAGVLSTLVLSIQILGDVLEATFYSVITAISVAFALGVSQRMIRTLLLMRVFAVNHKTAKPVAFVMEISHQASMMGAFLLVAYFLGDSFGTLWLISALVLFQVGKRFYENFLTHYSPARIKETLEFLQSLIKPKVKE
jgi:hypothetical protein